MTNIIIASSGNRIIGTTKDGFKLSATVELRVMTGKHEAVDHSDITNPYNVGVWGNKNHARSGQFDCSGQIRDEFPDGPEGFTLLNMDRDDYEFMLRLWETYAGNTLRPGCIHHPTPINVNRMDIEAYAKEIDQSTEMCPEGYRYGSKWLVKPIPENVMVATYQAIRRMKESLQAT